MLTFDDRDRKIREDRLALWEKRKGPRVGDYVILPGDDVRRFTYDWGDDIQTTNRGDAYGSSFYFGNGFMSFSGGLDQPILKARLELTGETREGAAWFFHHGQSGPHRGVHFKVPCRVFRIKAEG